jgi:hypothetical protein
MFRWLAERFKKREEATKTLLDVPVKVVRLEGQWFACFRAWDRGEQLLAGGTIAERVAVPGRDPSDALKQALRILQSIEPRREDDLLFLPRSQWPGGAGVPPSNGPIRSVFVYPDGMCAVFDAAGNQMSQYQGPWYLVGESIMRDAPDETEFKVASQVVAVDLKQSKRGWRIDLRC